MTGPPPASRRGRPPRPFPARRLAVATLALVALIAASCSDDTSSSTAASTTTTARGATSVDGGSNAAGVAGGLKPGALPAMKVDAPSTYAVGSLTDTFVDPTRPTGANGATPARPDRTLPTLVLYPAAGPPPPPNGAPPTPGAAPIRRRWPLVVFSHGVTGSGPDYSNTLRTWASAGYVVIAPNYPLSSPRGVPGGTSIGDVAAQTRDVSFLIDRLLAASGRPGPLEGMIDPDRIGLAGHSLGAITTLGAAFEACCFEPRVKAAAEFAGLFLPLAGNTDLAPGAAGRPVLIIHGVKDGTVPYRNGPAVFAKLAPPKYLITLPQEGHIPAYVEGPGAPAGKVVTVGTLDFFDRYLKGERRGVERMEAVVANAGPAVATLQADPG